MKLDRLDLSILKTLLVDGRITKHELGARIGLSSSACIERLNRLERTGYIRGYHVDINLDKLCNALTIITEVTLQGHTAGSFARFESAITKRPEVLECLAVGGGFDYVIKWVVRDIRHYQEIIEELLGSDIGIGTYFTYIVTKLIKRNAPMPIDLLMASRREESAAQQET